MYLKIKSKVLKNNTIHLLKKCKLLIFKRMVLYKNVLEIQNYLLFMFIQP